MTFIKVKHLSSNTIRSFKNEVHDHRIYQEIKYKTQSLFELDDNYDFCFRLIRNNGEKVIINSSSKLLEYIPDTTLELEIVPIASSPFLSDTTQFDIICDGCYTPVRGQRFRCETCEDFDLCSTCKSRVNHNPSHLFQVFHFTFNNAPLVETTDLDSPFESKSSVSSSTQTIYICDNCDSDIVGIRHTCSSCPDFDLCHSCFSIVKQTHPEQHQFTTHLAGTELAKKHKKQYSIPTPLNQVTPSNDEPILIQHIGIHCDHCHSQIVAIRYKCGHCVNFDLCSSCEEKSEQIHDKTHVFIKIRYQIQQLFKKPLLPKFSTFDETTDTSSLSSSSVTLDTFPELESTENNTVLESKVPLTTNEPNKAHELNATLICDMNIPDGTISKPKETFVKIWKVKNTGDIDWPVGSNLEFNGGTMLSVHPNGQPKIFAIPSLSPGEEACITAELQAPALSGHYTTYFCLCSPDGTPFSDNIWCTIVVSDDQKQLENPSSSMAFPTLSPENYDAYEYDAYSTTTFDVSNTTVTYTDSQISCFSPYDESVNGRYDSYAEEETDDDREEEESVQNEQTMDDSSVDEFVMIDDFYEDDERAPNSPIASSIHSISTVTPQAIEITPSHSIHEESIVVPQTEMNSLEITESTADDLKNSEQALEKLEG